jgi:hypothetical protein
MARLDEVKRLQKIAGILKENLGAEEVADYSEVASKMDRFMPEDEILQIEFDKLKKAGDVKELAAFIQQEADPDLLKNWMPDEGTLEGFAEYLIKN